MVSTRVGFVGYSSKCGVSVVSLVVRDLSDRLFLHVGSRESLSCISIACKLGFGNPIFCSSHADLLWLLRICHWEASKPFLYRFVVHVMFLSIDLLSFV